MAIFKCKMCGGSLEVSPDQHTAVCEYCGTEQTLPRLDDDRKANLYDRANHFRRNNDFDKAMGIYESILNEDNTDAEAYWSLVLCRYGIEYVEDPVTHKRIPTVNRAQFTSIFDDDNYKSALQHADGSQRHIYEEEARAINEIQKGILTISQKEEPFDVFICYKETDNSGRRTQDSVLANDLYYQLKNEGFKVFFARITLEDKLGSAYEPYIFAALNSAKVMVVLGTKPEHFNSAWVKNEWSRYLSIVKTSKGKKMLIPAYRDMDPYDLPEEFSHLQAQDMSKLGFMQDLIWGIKKITADSIPKASVKETVVINQRSAETAPLLKRAFMFLEDGEWDRADDFCEQVLNINPECAEAYIGKLMAELHCPRQTALKDQAEPFENRNNYEKVLRFADAKLKTEFTDCIRYIYDRNEHTRVDGIYQQAKSAMDAAETEADFKQVAKLFQSIAEYEDASALTEKCLNLAETARKDDIYDSAKAKMSGEQTEAYVTVIEELNTISGWRDTDELITACQNKIQEIKEKEERQRLERERQAEIDRQEEEKRKKKAKKIAMIVTPIVCMCIALVVVLQTVIIPSHKLKKANALIESGNYDTAYALLEEIDRNDVITESKYDRSLILIESGDYDAAYALLEEIERSDVILENKYDRATSLYEQEHYSDAIDAFTAIENYSDSKEQMKKCMLAYAAQLETTGKRDDAIQWYEKAGDKAKAHEIRYAYVQANKDREDIVTYEYLLALKDANYNDAKEIYSSLYKMSATLFFNNSKDNTSTHSSSVPQYLQGETQDCYYHYIITGGPPTGKASLKVVCESRWGWDEISREDYKVDRYDSKDNWEVKTETYYYGNLGHASNVYNYRVTIYDTVTGEKLAQEEVYTPYNY